MHSKFFSIYKMVNNNKDNNRRETNNNRISQLIRILQDNEYFDIKPTRNEYLVEVTITNNRGVITWQTLAYKVYFTKNNNNETEIHMMVDDDML